MAETKSTEAKGNDTRTADKSSTTPADRGADTSSKARGNLAPASESSDPEVHQLLAQRQAHEMNGGLDDDPEQEAVRKDARDRIAEIDKKLADLGVTAK